MKRPESVIEGGPCDTSGTAPELAECLAATCKAEARRTEWEALPVTPGFSFGPIRVKRAKSVRIPAVGTLGPGVTVMDMPSLRLDNLATLTLAGDATTGTGTVIIRVHGRLRLGRPAKIALDPEGVLTPRQVIWVVDGLVTMNSFDTVAGTVFANNTINIGLGSTIDGAVIGSSRITTGKQVTVTHSAFVGW